LNVKLTDAIVYFAVFLMANKRPFNDLII